MKVLCVAEKPSIAKSTTQILSLGAYSFRASKNKYIKNYDFKCKHQGNQMVDVTMTSVLGHLLASDFTSEYSSWDKVSPLTLFDAPIVKFVAKGNEEVRNNLINEARSSTEVMIWTDCDREGENIGAEIVEICREANSEIKVSRAKFSAIIPQQINRAWITSTDLDYRQSNAVDARIELDLRIGAAFTRLQTLTLRNIFAELNNNVISYGSCQFPTLGFVVDQYLKVQNFVSELFWKINVTLNRDNSITTFNWKRTRLFDRLTCLVIYEQCVENPLATVVKVTSREVHKWKPYPLTTVELLKNGSRNLHLSSDRIMQVSEKLYNKGYISYPRTETDQFDNQFDFNTLIEKQIQDPQWGDIAKKLLDGEFRLPGKGKHNDFAHPPIHPTTYVSNLTGEEKKVYEFVVRRFLACCSDHATGFETTVEIKIWEETFTVTGLVVLERNYLEVYPYDRWGDSNTNLPNFQEGETFIPTVCEMVEGCTTPPECLTEADLISIMDQNGIGTDATIHEHIAKIVERNYAKKEPRNGKTFIVPLKLGIALVEGYDSIGLDKSLSKPFLRREMESSLKLVCEGRQQKDNVVRESLTMYKDMYIKTSTNATNLIKGISKYLQVSNDETNLEIFNDMLLEHHPEPTRPIHKCFQCGRQLILKKKQSGGWMIGCQGFPNCNMGIKVPDIVSDILVSSDKCNRCTQNPEIPYYKLKIKFIPNKVPPWISEEYLGCVGGCDDFLNEYFVAIRSNQSNRMPLSSINQNNQANQPQSSQSSQPSQPSQSSRNFETSLTRQGNNYTESGSTNFTGNFTGESAYRTNSGIEPPKCKCNLYATLKKKVTPGENQGREFYTCHKAGRGRCRFFQWADESPSQGNSNNTNNYSNNTNNYSNNSNNYSNNSSNSSGNTGGNTCYNCGEAGHFSNFCNKPKKSNPNVSCFKCKQPGHWSNACPNATTNNESTRGRGRGGFQRGRGTRGHYTRSTRGGKRKSN